MCDIKTQTPLMRSRNKYAVQLYSARNGELNFLFNYVDLLL